jgi:hypothetical protein
MDDEQAIEATWSELIGPCIDAAAVAERLNASPREVARLTGAGHLLALFASDDTTVYPLFQFTDIDWRSLGLYLWALDYDRVASYRPWRIAAWLCSPTPLLEGRCPLDLICEGGADGQLLRLAASEGPRLTDDPPGERDLGHDHVV